MNYVTVSAKVDRKFYEKLKKYGVPISSVIKRALEEELRRREEEELRIILRNMQGILRKIPREKLVQAVRLSREER